MAAKDYTLNEAAEMLGYANASTLRLWCRQGRVDASKRGRDWLITARGIEQAKAVIPKRRNEPRKPE
jgi:transposase-like protein